MIGPDRLRFPSPGSRPTTSPELESVPFFHIVGLIHGFLFFDRAFTKSPIYSVSLPFPPSWLLYLSSTYKHAPQPRVPESWIVSFIVFAFTLSRGSCILASHFFVHTSRPSLCSSTRFCAYTSPLLICDDLHLQYPSVNSPPTRPLTVNYLVKADYYPVTLRI